MEVEFLGKFNKDISSINQKMTKASIIKIIEQVENARNISGISNVKKLKGFKEAYRIRVGDYRLGIFISGNKAQFARFVHRKDIYNLFP